MDDPVPDPGSRVIESDRHKRVFLEGRWRRLPIYRREGLEPGSSFAGPALVFERHCATLVSSSWRGGMDRNRCLVLSRESVGKR